MVVKDSNVAKLMRGNPGKHGWPARCAATATPPGQTEEAVPSRRLVPVATAKQPCFRPGSTGEERARTESKAIADALMSDL
jgi:hypothetical protein